MSVIARFEVIPIRDGSMSTAIASALRALDRYPVSYETTATDTIIEADSVDLLFEAVQAAHEAIPEDRVITSVQIDEDRRRPQHSRERVASVARELGHPPQRPQSAPGQQRATGGHRQPDRQQYGAESPRSAPEHDAQPRHRFPAPRESTGGGGARSYGQAPQ